MSDLVARLRLEGEASSLVAEVGRSEKALDSLKGTAGDTEKSLAKAASGVGAVEKSAAAAAGETDDLKDKFSGMGREGMAGGLKAAAGMALGGAAAGAALKGVQFLAQAYMDATKAAADLEIASKYLGAQAGISGAELGEMADTAAEAAGISKAAAGDMAIAYVSTGKIGREVLGDLIGLTEDYGVAAGIDGVAATRELAGAMADPAKGLQLLNDKFSILNDAQSQHILQLIEQGNESEAQRLITDALGRAIGGAAQETAGWSRMFDGLATSASNAAREIGIAIDRAIFGGTELDRLADAKALQGQTNATGLGFAFDAPGALRGALRGGVVGAARGAIKSRGSVDAQVWGLDAREQERKKQEAARTATTTFNANSLEVGAAIRSTQPDGAARSLNRTKQATLLRARKEPGEAHRLDEIDAALAELRKEEAGFGKPRGGRSGGGASRTGSNGGSGARRAAAPKTDRAAELAEDLSAEIASQKAYRAALEQGALAVDRFKIAEAGRIAVERSGLADGAVLTATIRERAEESERLAQSTDRLERIKSAEQDDGRAAAGLERQAAAARSGEQALEDLRIVEAGLARQRELGIDTLDQLAEADRAAAVASIASAAALERKAIATEKADAVAATGRDIDDRTAAETRRTTAVRAGIAAETAYAKAEFIRLEVERAGKTLTAEQVRELQRKAAALYEAQAAGQAADDAADLDEELRLLTLTADEREREVRALQIRANLLAQGYGDAEAAAKAAGQAADEAERRKQAAAIGDLKESLKRAYVDSGKLGFDQVGDYAKRRLREKIYEALLEKPFEIIVNALVKGQAGSAGGGLSGLGPFGEFLGKGMDSLKAAIPGMDALIAAAPQIYMIYEASKQLTAFGGNLLGFDPGQQRAADRAAGGGLGALPSLIIGALDEGDRPQAQADIVLRDGQFTAGGLRVGDEGPGTEIDALAADIVRRLNAAVNAFGLDLSGAAELYAGVGYVKGKDSEALGQGFYGGASNRAETLSGLGESPWDAGFHAGFTNTNETDSAALADRIVKETFLRALEESGEQLSAAERSIVESATNFEAAAAKIQLGRELVGAVTDAIAQLTDPAAFERQQALEAIEAGYKAMKAQAEELIAAGLVGSEVLAQLDELRELQVADALKKLGDAAETAADALADERPRMREWLDRLAVGPVAPVNPSERRGLAYAQYERQLEMARGGDAEAIANLTEYAERLLESDREATSSAADRLALYSKVTGDVGALAGVQPGAVVDPAAAAIGDLTTVVEDGLADVAAAVGDAGLTLRTQLNEDAGALYDALTGGDFLTIERLSGLLFESEQSRLALGFFAGEDMAVTRETAALVAGRIDANGDGIVSEVELQRAAATEGLAAVVLSLGGEGGLLRGLMIDQAAALYDTISGGDFVTVERLGGLLFESEQTRLAMGFFAGQGAEVTRETAALVAGRIDANGDGIVSQAELLAASNDAALADVVLAMGGEGGLLRGLLTDQAGRLTDVVAGGDFVTVERLAGLLFESEQTRLAMGFLAGQDGEVTRETAAMVAARIDANGDGVISQAELQAAATDAGLAGIVVALGGEGTALRGLLSEQAGRLYDTVSGGDFLTVERLGGLLFGSDLTREAIAALTGSNAEVTLEQARVIAERIDANRDGVISQGELQEAATTGGLAGVVLALGGEGTALRGTLTGEVGRLNETIAGGDFLTVERLGGLLFESEQTRAAMGFLFGEGAAVTRETAALVAGRIDANGDGVISRTELQTAAIDGGLAGVVLALSGEGSALRASYDAAAGTLFDQLVRGGDLSVTGLAEILLSTELGREAVAALMGDNRAVTLEGAREVLARIDVNGDGIISRTELQTAAADLGFAGVVLGLSGAASSIAGTLTDVGDRLYEQFTRGGDLTVDRLAAMLISTDAGTEAIYALTGVEARTLENAIAAVRAIDANGDGVVTQLELQGAASRAGFSDFALALTNDRATEIDELVDWFGRTHDELTRAGVVTNEQIAQLLYASDEGRRYVDAFLDGSLEPTLEGARRAVEALDSNRNGIIERLEFQAGLTNQGFGGIVLALDRLDLAPIVVAPAGEDLAGGIRNLQRTVDNGLNRLADRLLPGLDAVADEVDALNTTTRRGLQDVHRVVQDNVDATEDVVREQRLFAAGGRSDLAISNVVQ